MGRRTVLLIAALVVAALGTVLIFVYVQSIRNDVEDGQVPVEVLVATQQVTVGTTAGDASEAGAFELETLPASAVADGALSDIADVSGSALTTIYPGQQVLSQMFGQPQSVSGLEVAKDRLAMSVQLGDPERVAGFVVPGSEVVVFYTDTTVNPATTMTIVPRIKVLATGATTLATETTTTEDGESTTSEIPQAILTLEATQLEAQRIINGKSNGELQFGLLGDDTRAPTGRVTVKQDLYR